MFPTMAISSLLFSSVTRKQVQTHDFKIWTDIEKGKLCSSLESSECFAKHTNLNDWFCKYIPIAYSSILQKYKGTDRLDTDGWIDT